MTLDGNILDAPNLGRQHVIRVGAMGTIGRFTSIDAVRYPRGSRVVVRTGRGLEVGEVLAEPSVDTPSKTDGSILRGFTIADDLLLARLDKNRDDAFAACTDRIARLGLPAVLMDVEHLFDGKTLAFYFLGEITDELEAITDELAELYESRAQFRQFAEAVDEGCGPGCGTDEAAGCKTCTSGCAIAETCATRR